MTALSLHVERAHAIVDLLYESLVDSSAVGLETTRSLDAIGALLGYAEDELARHAQDELAKDAAAVEAEQARVEAHIAAERKRQVRR